MIVRAGSGWQTILADLSLILFMVTAAALSQAGEAPKTIVPARAPSPMAEPLAVWREAAGAQPLAAWLEAQSPDPRAQLTILAPYGPGRQDVALAQATRLAGIAGRFGVAARIVIEPGPGETTATLAYDVPAATLAQGLHHETADTPQEQHP